MQVKLRHCCDSHFFPLHFPFISLPISAPLLLPLLSSPHPDNCNIFEILWHFLPSLLLLSLCGGSMLCWEPQRKEIILVSWLFEQYYRADAVLKDWRNYRANWISNSVKKKMQLVNIAILSIRPPSRKNLFWSVKEGNPLPSSHHLRCSNPGVDQNLTESPYHTDPKVPLWVGSVLWIWSLGYRGKKITKTKKKKPLQNK